MIALRIVGQPEFAAEWLDLSFRKEANTIRNSVITTRYGLICTMVIPHPSTGKPLSGKAKDLADFCVARGLTKEGILEDMFCHFAEDTKMTLHVGRESTQCPREERIIPGWDPRNDRNGDGKVDDAEFAACAEAIRWGFAEETLAIVRAEAARCEGDSGDAWRDCIDRLAGLEARVAGQEAGSGEAVDGTVSE